MRSKNNKFIILVGIIFLLLLSVTIGFAYLTKSLQINGTTNIEKNSWVIYFDKAVEREGSVQASKELKIDDTKTIIDFGMTLDKPGDYYEFDVNVVNDGSVDAMIDTVLQVGIEESQEKYISYTATYTDGTEIKHCDLLASGTKEKVRVRVEFKEVDNKEDLPDSDIDLTLKLELNYIQADSCAVAPVVKRVLYINPNGGEYKGTSSITTIQGDPEDEITLEEPTRYAADFIGWQLEDGTMLEGNTIKLENQDITIKAVWEISNDVVARIGENYYLTLQEAFNVATTNDTIYLLKDVTESPDNNKQVKLDLQTHKVRGTLTNTGTMQVINGTIESTSGASVINKGTFTLGINDDEVKTDGVALIGTTIGIDQQGTFNFYDGYIEGIVGIKGEYNEIPENYFVFVDRNAGKDCQKIYLTETPTRAVAKTITGGEVYYFNLQDAINTSVVTGFNIYAVRDFEAAYTITVEENESTLFDITGYTVDFGNDVTNNGTLTIKNSNTDQGVLNVSRPINNNGTLNIETIEINQTTPANIIENQGELNIKESTLTALAGYALNANGGTLNMDDESYLQANTYGLNIPSGKEFTIDGGNIKGIYNQGELEINGGIIEGESYSIYNASAQSLTLNGGLVKSSNIAIFSTNNSSMIITVNGGTIRGATGLFGNSGTVTLNGGNIVATYHGINYGTNTFLAPEVIINGGNITINDERGIYSVTGVTTVDYTMTGGEILVSSKDSGTGVATNRHSTITGGRIEVNTKKGTATGVSLNNGILNIKENILIKAIAIEGTGIGIDKSGSAEAKILAGNIYGANYGIYNRNSYVLQIGDKDGNINIETPQIIGCLYGIYNNASISSTSFYDGILKGQTAGYYGNINATEDGTKIVNSTETIEGVEYQTNYLVEEENYLRVGETEFNSLTKAINATENEETITVIKSMTVGDVITIPENKNITLDLNGKELQFASTITNNGTFTIDDTSENKKGKIINTSTYAITNNKNVEINNGTIEGKTYTIYITKSGTITLNNGTIKSDNTGIYGTVSSNITINGGTIISNSMGIRLLGTYNNSTIIMKGGKILVGDNNVSSAVNGIDVYKFTMIDGEIIINAPYSGVGVIVQREGTISGGKIKVNAEKMAAIGLESNGEFLFENDFSIEAISKENLGIGIKGSTYSTNYKIKIEQGYIYGSSYGIQNGYTALELGKKDGSVVVDTPVIVGREYSIYKGSGNVYFYDGILKGGTSSYYGAITGIEDGTKLVNGLETINDFEYKTTHLVEEEKFLRVGEKEYNSLSKAIDAIENEGVILVTASTMVGEVVTIPTEKNISLDLNGYELQFTSTITNNGTLIIDDTSEEKKGKISNGSTITIRNNKNLEINGGEVFSQNNAVYNNSTLTLNGGSLESTTTAIWSDSSSSTISLNGGSIKGNVGIGSSYGTINIRGGEIRATNQGISVDTKHYNDTKLNIEAGKIFVEGTNAAEGAVGLTSFTMSGGEIFVHNTGNGQARGVNCHGTLSMTEGTIKAISDTQTGVAVNGATSYASGLITGGYIYGSTYGLKIEQNTTIGTKDGEINTESPEIVGGLYGLYNSSSSCNVYFYDGILKGQTAGYYGAINEIEEETRIEETIETVDEETEYIVNKLVPNNNIVENSTTNKKYKSIQSAIEESNNGDTLKLIDNVSNYFVVPISKDKNITLDLNGYEFYTTRGFDNKGTLTITDTSETSSEIKTISSILLINNEGTLNINNIKLSNTASQYIVNNKGTAILTNVSINGVNGIQNETTGTLNLNNPNIEVTYTGVENKGKIEVEGGSIKKDTNSGGYAIYLYSGTETNTFKNTTIEGNFYKNSTDETTITNSTLNNIENKKGMLTIEECTLNNISNSSNAALTINKGIQTGGYISNSGTMTINDLTGTNIENQTVWGAPIYNFITNSGTLEISNMQMNFVRMNSGETRMIYNNGTLKLNNSSATLDNQKTYNYYGLYNYGSGNAILNNTNIHVTNGSTSYGIYSQDANSITTIQGGTIEAKDATTSYGIYLNNGTVTIGEKESIDSENYGTENADVSIESPLIKGIGATIGIGVKKVSGYFNYYDGKLIGSTSAKPDTTTEVEYNYEVSTYNEDDTGYEYNILEFIKARDNS